MSNIEWFLLAALIFVGLIAGYYQLQILGYSKPGKLSSVWRGGWIFHPEDLEEGGNRYRKKALVCLGIFVVLALVTMAYQGNI